MSASQRQEMMKNKSTALFLVHQVIWLDLNLGYILEAVITHILSIIQDSVDASQMFRKWMDQSNYVLT